jgi:hypothetical protein
LIGSAKLPSHQSSVVVESPCRAVGASESAGGGNVSEYSTLFAVGGNLSEHFVTQLSRRAVVHSEAHEEEVMMNSMLL